MKGVEFAYIVTQINLMQKDNFEKIGNIWLWMRLDEYIAYFLLYVMT